MRTVFLYLSLLFTLIIFSNQGFASQVDQEIQLADTSTLPTVFLIGEHEAAFEELNLDHQVMLLSACGNNMDLAFDKWLGLLNQMERFAELRDFDLKGVKCWLNIFWEKDGTIRHIAYFLKPNSKNIDLRYLTAFFKDFAKNYTFPVVSDTRYSHYGSASFPTFQKRKKQEPVPNPTGLVKDGKKNQNKY